MKTLMIYFRILDFDRHRVFAGGMKMNQGIKITSVLFVAALVCAGCKQAETTPQIAPIVTNAPVIAPPTNAPVAVTNAVPTAVLTPPQAKDHVGEDAIVRGEVFGVHITAKGDAFINVGAAYPDAPFTAVCFQGAIPADDLKKLDGKTVSFKGKIKDHNGKTEIILDSADQISE
jgi:hypothetical protein